ncbi:MAG: methionine--tRNA ligase subunit beta, partial [Candidatus Cloacimonetes bacterium]|nr:methionine--tRNA ligase subunit beta [Candidatus Cloacimonadota bacterium]
LGNLANRVYVFAEKYFDNTVKEPGVLSEYSQEILSQAYAICDEIKISYASFKVRNSLKLALDVARIGNKYFDETKPWVTVKDEKSKAEETIFVCAELLRILSIVFYPIIPTSMLKLRTMLKSSADFSWKDLQEKKFRKEATLQKIEPLFPKIDDKSIEKQIADLLAKSANSTSNVPEAKAEISYDDFCKLDMRIVKIVNAEKIKKSQKLLKVKVDLGNEVREIVSGIAEFYKPEEIVGRKVLMLINLAPKKIMGVESKGMILAVHDESDLSLLSPEKDLPAGSVVS